MRRLALAVLALAAALTGLAPPAAAAVVNGGALTNGQQVTGTVSRAGDDIRWTFPAVTGRHVTFDVTASSWGGGSASLRFYNAAGNQWDSCVVTGPTWCELTPNATATWSVVLDPVNSSTGRATFRFAEDQATRSLASPNPTRTADAAISIRGQDAWFSFPAETGKHVTFDVTSSSWGTGSAYLRFYNASGGQWDTCVVTGPTWCEITPNSTGTWRVALDPVNGSTGSLRFTYAADPAVRGLAAGTAATATVAVRGQDVWFSFPAATGKHVTFDVTSSSWGTGSAYLRFYNAAGNQWDTCVVTGPTWCEITPNSTGTWRVALDPVNGSTGSLRMLYVADQAQRALTAGVATTAAVSVRGQDAWFSFPAETGRHVTFDVAASSWGTGSAYLRFYNALGNQWDTCVVTGPTWCETTPNSTGTWRVALDPVNGSTGSLRFTYAPDQATRAMTAGAAVSSTIALRGQDAWFTYPVVAGRRLVFTASASSWGTGSANLRFYNALGNQWDTCDVTGPRQCEITPNATGTWRVSLDPVNGSTGSLTMRYDPVP